MTQGFNLPPTNEAPDNPYHEAFGTNIISWNFGPDGHEGKEASLGFIQPGFSTEITVDSVGGEDITFVNPVKDSELLIEFLKDKDENEIHRLTEEGDNVFVPEGTKMRVTAPKAIVEYVCVYPGKLAHEAIASPAELTVLSPDRDLAVANLTRRLEEAKASGQVKPAHLELFELQRDLARTIPRGESGYSREENDRVEAWSVDFKQRYPSYGRDVEVRWDLHPGTLVMRGATSERWKIVGVDPKETGLGRELNHQELLWKQAAQAEQERVSAEANAQAKREAAEAGLQEILDHNPIL
jgi:hypothetical protein